VRSTIGSLDRRQAAERADLARQRALGHDVSVWRLELSLRPRKCLASAGIRTVGELTRTTEAELLQLKNCGRLSLREVKGVLGSMGLRLAARKRAGDARHRTRRPADPLEEIARAPIDSLGLSTRPWTSLRRAGLETVGQLVQMDEAALLALPRFGRKSLLEVERVLGALGLRLGTLLEERPSTSSPARGSNTIHARRCENFFVDLAASRWEDVRTIRVFARPVGPGTLAKRLPWRLPTWACLRSARLASWSYLRDCDSSCQSVYISQAGLGK
jgi:hypothetical protein